MSSERATAIGGLPDIDELRALAERRWQQIARERPDLEPAVSLQRALVGRMLAAVRTLEAPQPQLPVDRDEEMIAALARGEHVFSVVAPRADSPVIAGLSVDLCRTLAEGAAAGPAEHLAALLASSTIDPLALVAASIARSEQAVRGAAVHHDVSPDLLWLVGEMAAGPVVHRAARALGRPPTLSALAAWSRGWCPFCASWPALAEFERGGRVLRCSFCAADWRPSRHCCVYCGDDGERFRTIAGDLDRPGRRLECCSACAGYLKSLDVDSPTPFPLLAIEDLASTDLDTLAMDLGFRRPPLPRPSPPCLVDGAPVRFSILP
jgi:hypothetical protein